MNYYERFRRLINDKINGNELTEEFVEHTTEMLDFYLRKNKITQNEYDTLISLMNPNVE